MRTDFPLQRIQRRQKGRSRLAKAMLMATAAFMGGLFPALVTAQVQLPAVNLGDTNFEDGFAGPGFLLEEFPDVYAAGTFKDGKGATVPGSNSLHTISTTSHIAYVSSRRVLGAWIGGEILVPMADVELKRASGPDTTERGFADPILGPLALQWSPRKIGRGVFVQRAILDLTVPIGKYSDRRPVNIGNHFVTINPYYAFTYEEKKLEISLRVHYLWSGMNSDPFVGLGIQNMQPGQAFHANYATSYEVRKGIRVGFNGYWLQQLTDHRIDGKEIPDSKERTVGLGPGLQFGGNGFWLRANSYLETDVRNRALGTRVTIRISKTLGAKGPKP